MTDASIALRRSEEIEARLPKLRGFLATHDFVKNADYRGLFGVSRSVALRELRRLANEGFVEMVGERGGARYVPRPGTLAGRTKVNADRVNPS